MKMYSPHLYCGQELQGESLRAPLGHGLLISNIQEWQVYMVTLEGGEGWASRPYISGRIELLYQGDIAGKG